MSISEPESTAHSGQPQTAAQAQSARPSAEAGAVRVIEPLEQVPPAGEDIHLPPGTPIPLVIAIGLTLGLVGTTIDWLWTFIGGIIFLVALVMWIRDTKREVDHLPDELGPAGHH